MNELITVHVGSVRHRRRLSHSVLWLVVSQEAYDGGLRFSFFIVKRENLRKILRFNYKIIPL